MDPHIRYKPLYTLRTEVPCWQLLAKIPQADVKLGLEDPPIHEEIKKATMQLKVGKSPCIDGISAEV